ncbi:DUF5684 domain-containing protein [Microbacterium sulfonylureivorans]|uniref:DUF5684 domain-containing protein n=1 Tax=Microbacterium sulfonylureivorans TaxID=2486854 RepID=UPI001F0CDD0B|nr:DUF5684 domain-containing protein [Microbacterium sulfonylureivorans]
MISANVVTDTADLTTLWGPYSIVGLIFYVITVVALWKVFSKAGYPGILAIIPIVNFFILVKIAGYSAWLGLLYFIPIVNIVWSIIVAIRVGKGFGKGGAWSFFLLWLFAFIGFFILGFGRATYTKPA